MTKKRAVLIGAGSYGEALLTYLNEDYTVVAFIDDDLQKKGSYLHNTIIAGTFNDLIQKNIDIAYDVVFCAIGNNATRVNYLSKLQQLGIETPSYIHSSVQITKDTNIGKAVYILPNCSLMPHSSISDFTIISIGSTITHHVSIGKGVMISCGVTIGAEIIIEDQVLVGVGSTILSGKIRICKGALIGAGSVIIKDVPERAVMVGSPGKLIKYLSE